MEAQACSRGREPESETRYRNYVVQIFQDEDLYAPDGCVEVIQDGLRVASYELGNIVRFEVGGTWKERGKERPLPLGKDVAGTGEPNIVIRWIRGTGSCCVGLLVLAVGKRFRYLTEIDLGRADLAYFSDVDHDSRPELVTWEQVWNCWRASCADSAAPKLILRYRDGGFRLATELMRKPPPTAKQLESRRRKIAAAAVDSHGVPLPSELWKQMLDLIYSGNAAAGWRLFEAAWPGSTEDKEAFLNDFRTRLTTSKHWPEIQRLNRGRVW